MLVSNIGKKIAIHLDDVAILELSFKNVSKRSRKNGVSGRSLIFWFDGVGSDNTLQVATILVLAAVAQAQLGSVYDNFYNGYYGGLYNNGFYNGLYNNGLYNNRLAYRPYNYGYNFKPAPLRVAPSAPVEPSVRPVIPPVTPNEYDIIQYHTTDEFGRVSYGYAYPGQAADNFQDEFGNQIGSYSYINPDGREIRVSYVADANGFRIVPNGQPKSPRFDELAPIAVEETFDPVQEESKPDAALDEDSRKKRRSSPFFRTSVF